MNLNLENKVAIVTGGSAGLGLAIARSLSGEGAAVAISGRSEKKLEQAAAQIMSGTKNEVFTVSGDMSRADAATQLLEKVMARFGRVHILINNVGGAVRGPFTALDTGQWTSGLDLNLMSAIHMSAAVVPHMQRQQWGRIINIAALSATEPNQELIVSNVAKSGLLGFSKTLSRELAADNILVNAVSPGLITSPQNDRYFSDDERQAAIGHIPLGRFGCPEEFAHTVTFLCSEQAGYITGQNLIIDGGLGKGV